jgi:tRNA A-37 threonylcarbamoyl transferase component Bud32
MNNRTIEINPEYAANDSLAKFIEHLPEAMVNGEGYLLYNKRNLIKYFDVPGIGRIVVKRYKRPSLLQRLIYSFFRDSKAKRAFHNAAELRKRGIDTPTGIAFVEDRQYGLFKYGYYLSDYDGASPIREKLVIPEMFDTVMAEDFAAFAAELHGKGILHHDLNSTNVLYHKAENGHYAFSVIDINRMDFMPFGAQPSMPDCLENMTRFTGRMDLYEYVLRRYVEIRGWDKEAELREAIRVKVRHDEQWRRRKAFLRKLSPWKKR